MPLDNPEYIGPELQNFIFHDVTTNMISFVAQESEVEYLGAAEFPQQFPVEARICGYNHRLMVNLVCRHRDLYPSDIPPALNIIFLVNTGSHVSYLSKQAMEALAGPTRSYIDAMVQEKLVHDFYLSPIGSDFENVNVLGMDFISRSSEF